MANQNSEKQTEIDPRGIANEYLLFGIQEKNYKAR